ncbi:MAG: hypothetical protein ACK5VX_06630 [Akkermansiaceae bacterium]
MIYLLLAASYRSSPVREEFGEYIESDELNVSDQLKDELRLWSDNYQPVIYLDMNSRKNISNEITELDLKGIFLAGRLASEMGGDVKVKYYSEGLLKFIP